MNIRKGPGTGYESVGSLNEGDEVEEIFSKQFDINQTVELDGQKMQGSYTLIAACNGQWYGGSFNPTPEAVPDDGLLDFVIIDRVSRLTVANLVGKYAKGRGKEFPDLIHMYRGKELKVKCDRVSMVNVDGERLDSDSLSFSVSAKKIRFIVPVGADWKKIEA